MTVAPALFDHIEHHIELGYDDHGIARGRELAARLGLERAVDDVREVAEPLQHEGKVAVVGFCWGGTVALLALKQRNHQRQRGRRQECGARSLPDATQLSATLENEADATLENEATGSCCLVCRVLGSHAGQGVDSAVA